jgi:hypothetical protein
MKITKKQLKKIIIENLLEDSSNEDTKDIHLTMDVSNRLGFSFSVKASNNRVDAFFENEKGENRKLSNNEEDKQLLLGVLVLTLETAKKETKHLIIKLIARLIGESESDEDLVNIGAKIKNDRILASYAQHVKDPKTRLI